MNESFDVVVVGAGLAGLAAGATAAPGASTLILDGHQPGGRASTDERGDYRFNRGPHALYRGGEASAVLARLGVSTPGAVPPAEARGRLGDRVDVLPATATTLLRSRLLSVRGKIALIRFLSGVKKWRPADVAGLTVGQWLDTFKLPEDARKVALFLVRTTTYANDERTLSADVAASQIQMALANNVLYLDNGWGSMVESLANAARRHGAEIRTGTAVTSITRAFPDGDLTVSLSGGQQIQAGAVVLAAGTPAAAAALLGERPRPGPASDRRWRRRSSTAGCAGVSSTRSCSGSTRPTTWSTTPGRPSTSPPKAARWSTCCITCRSATRPPPAS
jgi:phytoene dehydrogenase-like protein